MVDVRWQAADERIRTRNRASRSAADRLAVLQTIILHVPDTVHCPINVCVLCHGASCMCRIARASGGRTNEESRITIRGDDHQTSSCSAHAADGHHPSRTCWQRVCVCVLCRRHGACIARADVASVIALRAKTKVYNAVATTLELRCEHYALCYSRCETLSRG